MSGVAFSGDGNRVVSSSDDGTVRLWDVTAEKEIEPHLSLDVGATAVAMSPSGLVAVGAGNGKVWIWDPSVAGSERAVVEAAASITDVALSPDGSLLAFVVRDSALTVVEAADGHGSGPIRVPTGAAFGGDHVLVVGHGDKVEVLDPVAESPRRLRFHL